ncbi:MAG: hypothetical protein R3C99_23955 [Pirellulaceae bacterium]
MKAVDLGSGGGEGRRAMIPLVVIVVYLGLLLLLGATASRLFRGTAQDYMLASHSIGPVLLKAMVVVRHHDDGIRWWA